MVLLAKDGQDALTVYRKAADPIDLVILDMVMPIMSGRNCFAALKKYDPQARVILSSGFTCEEDLEVMRLGGLKGFIRKPYSSAILSQVVHDALK